VKPFFGNANSRRRPLLTFISVSFLTDTFTVLAYFSFIAFHITIVHIGISLRHSGGDALE
jgi:hypothetical protein